MTDTLTHDDRAELLDLRAERVALLLLLDRAQADGGKVIYIDAVLDILLPEPEPS